VLYSGLYVKWGVLLPDLRAWVVTQSRPTWSSTSTKIISIMVFRTMLTVSSPNQHNTQKRATTFTLQAASNRYIENLAIAAAWQDMQQDIMANNDPFVLGYVTGGIAGDSDATSTPNNDATPAPSGTLSGRGLTILWSAGDPSPIPVVTSFCPTQCPSLGDSDCPI
jgi:hypothetical protein